MCCVLARRSEGVGVGRTWSSGSGSIRNQILIKLAMSGPPTVSQSMWSAFPSSTASSILLHSVALGATLKMPSTKCPSLRNSSSFSFESTTGIGHSYSAQRALSSIVGSTPNTTPFRFARFAVLRPLPLFLLFFVALQLREKERRHAAEPGVLLFARRRRHRLVHRTPAVPR